MIVNRNKLRHIRKKRNKGKMRGTPTRPRLCVFKSNKNIYAQLIDDGAGVTIVSSSSARIDKETRTESGKKIGADIAKKALKANIKEIVFDRSGYKYHGIIKVLADEVRKGGLKF